MKRSLRLLIAAGACTGLIAACAGSDRHATTPGRATYTAAGEAAQVAQKNVALAERARASGERGPMGQPGQEREPVVGRELIIIEPQVEITDEAEEGTGEAAAAPESEPTAEPLRVMEGQTAYVRRSGDRDPDGAGFHSELTAASSDLAVGSIVRVVRTDTDDSLVLHISQSDADVPSKMLKLSSNAATRLGLNGHSVVPIRVEVLFEPGEPGLEE